jgi:hypothetical protein
MKGGIMIRQLNTLSIGIVQMFEHSKIKLVRFLAFAVVFLSSAAGTAQEAAQDHDARAAEGAFGQSQTTNVMCPVMRDMKVNPDIFTDYQGKRVIWFSYS